MTRRRRVRLLGEMAVLFFGLPLAYLAGPHGRWAFFLLWPAAAVAGVVLWRDPTFDRARLGRGRGFGRAVRAMVPLWAVAAVGMMAAVAWLAPGRLFELPRERPGLWALVVVLYPVLSVYPQELIWRALFFHRYGPALGGTAATVCLSAAAFGWMHVILLNGLAVVLTLAGGGLFAVRYARTESLVAASVEHALYGVLVFTVGLGTYFVVR